MKTLKDIKRVAAQVGATVEEDTGYRDMRVFQIIAPEGKVWTGSGCHCRQVHWQTGTNRFARAWNDVTFRELTESLALGVREMAPDEAELCAVD